MDEQAWTDRAIERLSEIADSPCPRCGNKDFTVQDGPTYLSAPDRPNTMGYKTLPVLIAYCQNCGWIAMHAPSVLGLDTHPQRGSDEI